MILFFSGTGNSKYVAKYLSDKLADEIVDLGKAVKNGEKFDFSSQRPWVFVFPTYAWGAPEFLFPHLYDGVFSGAKQVYFILTCGANIGNAEGKLKKFATAKGLDFCGAFPLVMPDNYVIMYEPSTPEESAEKIKSALPVMDGLARQISEGKPFETKRVGLLSKLTTAVMNGSFYRAYVKTKPFFATDECISCGKCERGCPLNNITLDNGRPVWGNNCTHCTACINGCPKKAIQYGDKTAARGRYYCADYDKEKKA